MDPFIVKLHEEAKTKAAQIQTAEASFIEVLARVDEHKIFIHYGYASLFEYCVKDFGLSEANTCNYITVARKARDIPQLKSELSAGNLSISKIRKMTPVLTPDNAELWIHKAKSLTHKALEKEVAKERPEMMVQVGGRYISADRLVLQLCVTEELMEQLGRAKDVLSQKTKASVPLEKALEVVVGEFLERHDPVKKAERAITRAKEKEADANIHAARQTQEVKDTLFSTSRREHILQMTKHYVMARDGARCTFVYPNGQRCRERRFLQMHHIRPVSQGGPDTEANLTMLCSAHHKHIHFKMGQKPFHRQEAPVQQSLGWTGNEGSRAH